jgi:hypothetical protein
MLRNRISKLITLAIVGAASFALKGNAANAAVVIDGSKVQSNTYVIQGTLMAIDAPSGDNVAKDGPAGPIWTEAADEGFALLAGARFQPEGNRPGWEPDGTDSSLPRSGYSANKPETSVTYTFDIPDGAIVHGVYADWYHQKNHGSGHEYSYDEGALTTYTRAATGAANHLRLQWLDSGNSGINVNFERIFAGDISVAGGDGFEVKFTHANASGTYPNIDAVVIDYTAPAIVNVPEPATATLAMLGLGGLMMRRRRNA